MIIEVDMMSDSSHVNKKSINFAHPYHKLTMRYFTKIKSKSQADKFKVGDIVSVTFNKKHLFNAKIIHMFISKINNIRLDTLRRDVEYDEFTITSHKEFADFLNNFYPEDIDLYTEVVVLNLIHETGCVLQCASCPALAEFCQEYECGKQICSPHNSQVFKLYCFDAWICNDKLAEVVNKLCNSGYYKHGKRL